MTKSILQIDPALLSHIQEVQDSYAEVTGLATILVDASGHDLTKQSRESEFYRTLAASPAGAHLMQKGFLGICSEHTPGFDSPILSACCHTGLLVAMVPVCTGGTTLAYWVAGQVRDDVHLDYYDDYMIRLGCETGISSHILKILLCQLPEISARRLAQNAQLLHHLTQLTFRPWLEPHTREATARKPELLLATIEPGNTELTLTSNTPAG